MRCNSCPYYQENPSWNYCAVDKGEYFPLVYDCRMVNDDGTINEDEIRKIYR